MFKLDTYYAQADDCFIEKRGNGNHVRYDIISESEGPMLTLNIVGYGKSETVIALKDYSENAGTYDWAKSVGLIKRTLGIVPAGWVHAYLIELDTNVLADMMR